MNEFERFKYDRDSSDDPNRGPGFRAKYCWMFVAIDKGDSEGVVAISLPNGMMMPAVATDERRLEELRPMIKRLAYSSHHRIKLIRFSVREELEEYGPKTPRA